jgi:myo-inositol-1(or 4)-monophosphatase
LDTLNIKTKGQNDFVTEIDQAAEEAILQVIGAAYPTHSFLTEESGEINKEDTNHIWIIDPLDGTTNYIHGYPHYAVSIALQVRGRIEHGVIYNPVTQDLFTASRGMGAQLNGKRIRVTTRSKLDSALISTGMPRPKRYLQNYFASIEKMHGSIAGIRRSGSSTLDLAYVAAGFLDAYWNVDNQPWDMAAGSLLVREAGGMVADIEGGADFMKNGSIVAANAKLMKPILQLLRL